MLAVLTELLLEPAPVWLPPVVSLQRRPASAALQMKTVYLPTCMPRGIQESRFVHDLNEIHSHDCMQVQVHKFIFLGFAGCHEAG